MKGSMRVTAVLAFTCAFNLHAQQQKIDRVSLPSAVEQTVQKLAQGTTLKGLTTEREDGKKVYEAELMVDGHSRDVQIALDGSVNEIEEEVAMKSLPANVSQALAAKAGKATIVKVESLTKHDKLVAYEAATRSGAKRGEIQVGPDGETLLHEE